MDVDRTAAKVVGTHVRIVHSEITGADYELSIAYPDGYEEASDRYPLLLVLDAPYFFAHAWLTSLVQFYDGHIPQMLVVGIGRPCETLSEWNGLREIDFTPVPLEDSPGSGHADDFLNALEHELLPEIDAQLRTAPGERTIWGHSLGGMFALYVLQHRSDLFSRYVATSPSLHDVHRVVPSSSSTPTRSVPVFISVGEEDLEHRPLVDAYVAALKDSGPEEIDLTTRLFADTGHTTAAILGLVHGLQALAGSPTT
ncbi:MAG TPA: alpha/beta hydrolase-fold protein [Propionibacteriaceae bacterium]